MDFNTDKGVIKIVCPILVSSDREERGTVGKDLKERPQELQEVHKEDA